LRARFLLAASAEEESMTRLALLSILLTFGCERTAPPEARASGVVMIDARAAERLRVRLDGAEVSSVPDEATLRRGVHAGVGR
jgi:hypothetical protein